jgi:hypothetical protein
MQPCCEPGGIGTEKPDETLACPARSRLHGGKRQQASAVQGLRRQSRPNARLFLAESLTINLKSAVKTAIFWQLSVIG